MTDIVMKIEIIQVQPNGIGFEMFSAVPASLYPSAALPLQKSGDQLNTDFLFACLIVLADQKPLGRLALYDNSWITFNGKKVLLAGNFECVSNDKISAALLHEAMRIAKNEGAAYLIGPMNGSTWDTYRFTIGTRNDLFFSENLHHTYYTALWENAGFTELERYISTVDRYMRCDAPAVIEREKELIAQGVVFRNIRLDDYENELKKLFPFCLRVFSSNKFYSPVSEEHFLEKYVSVKNYITEKGVVIAENNRNEIVGFMFGFHDHFSSAERRFIIKTVARDPAPEYKGMGNILGNMGTRYALINGYDACIHAFMHMDNRSVHLSDKYSGRPLREYVLLKKELV
ncbi:MAG: hypothetical protein Fur0041_18540 [Bacteroidia bacterium]